MQTTNQSEVFLELLLSGSRQGCSALAHDYMQKGGSVISLYEDTIKKALYKVGELWEFNKISVAAEHMATSIAQSVMNELFAGIISKERTGNRVLAASVENEFHQVGIKMVADVFEMNGWDTYFLGANTPADELIRFAGTIRPDIFALSMSVYSHVSELQKMIKKIKAAFADVTILVGGHAFNSGGAEILEKFNNVVYISDLRILTTFISEWRKNE